MHVSLLTYVLAFHCLRLFKASNDAHLFNQRVTGEKWEMESQAIPLRNVHFEPVAWVMTVCRNGDNQVGH